MRGASGDDLHLRYEYAGLFGATTGDKIRLGDTQLYVEIERDLRVMGDEAIYGGGKTLRDGMGMDNQLTSADGALDLVITNVVIIDATLGIVKADVGVKDGRIVGIGKAGNPGMMDGVTPGLAVGPATDAISGEHCILTAGGIDASCPLHRAAAGGGRRSATASPRSSAVAWGRPTAPTARPSPRAPGTSR